MTLAEILRAVDEGLPVHWQTSAYVVERQAGGRSCVIRCLSTGHCIGLTWADGGDITSQVARTTRPIVFVGDRIPPASVWTGRAPSIIALSQVTTLGESVVVDHDAVVAAILEADALASSPSQEPVRGDQLALMIRRQVKAEEKTQLTDDILVAAYQQEGSVRKAAAFLSERTGLVVTKDKVQQALRRNEGVCKVASSKNRSESKEESSNRRSM